MRLIIDLTEVTCHHPGCTATIWLDQTTWTGPWVCPADHPQPTIYLLPPSTLDEEAVDTTALETPYEQT